MAQLKSDIDMTTRAFPSDDGVRWLGLGRNGSSGANCQAAMWRAKAGDLYDLFEEYLKLGRLRVVPTWKVPLLSSVVLCYPDLYALVFCAVARCHSTDMPGPRMMSLFGRTINLVVRPHPYDPHVFSIVNTESKYNSRIAS
jgi:hypothetical protein